MYLRAVHAELNVPALQAFIKSNPLGLFITSIQSPNFPLIQCTHTPWMIDVPSPSDNAGTPELGRLRAHIARANPHSKAMIEAVRRQQEAQHQQQNEQRDGSAAGAADAQVLETEVTVMFNGPADAYVTPKFYTATKPDTGKVVPTWNYSAVQAYGRARIHFDAAAPATAAFLQRQIEDLTAHAETSVMRYDGREGRAGPWRVGDAPAPFVEVMKKAIIGIEVEIDRLEGKYKMSQEMAKAGDREGIVEGFRALKTDSADRIAQTVVERAALRDAAKAAS